MRPAERDSRARTTPICHPGPPQNGRTGRVGVSGPSEGLETRYVELVADALAHGDVTAAVQAFAAYEQTDPDGARRLKFALIDLLREMT